MNILTWFIFIAAAFLEVVGDSVIRKGLIGNNPITIILGCLMLSSYGLVVNLVKWDFSKLLGVYAAFFALISILWGYFIFKENVSILTWIGLIIMVLGAFIIQAGQK